MKMKSFVILLAVLCIGLSSCKKDYDCICTNSSGSYTAGTIKNTKNRAKKHCQSLSTGATTCDLNTK